MSRDVYLRLSKGDDIEFMLQLENDQEIWKVSQTKEPFLLQDIEHFINDSNHKLVEDLQLRNIIVMSVSDKPIGIIDLFNYNVENNSAGLGITICKEYRGKAYGTAALNLLIDKAFSEYGLEELHCTIFTDNYASISLFESHGFIRKKLLKNNVQYQGQSYDVYLYGLKKRKYL